MQVTDHWYRGLLRARRPRPRSCRTAECGQQYLFVAISLARAGRAHLCHFQAGVYEGLAATILLPNSVVLAITG
jgi:hypothetical protein